MSAKLGKNARIKRDGTTMARMTSLSVTVNNGNADITEFGDDWEHHAVTILNWNASCDGYLDLDDTIQEEFHAIAMSGGTFDDIEFWEDGTNYWTPDTVTDSDAEASIESYTWNAEETGIVTFSMSVKGSGPITRTS